jgi:hypothetical protein
MLLSSMLKLRSVRAIPNVINFDSFSLDARHLFQNVVFFFSYMRLHMSYIVVFRIKISIRITKKKYVSVFEKNILTV